MAGQAPLAPMEPEGLRSAQLTGPRPRPLRQVHHGSNGGVVAVLHQGGTVTPPPVDYAGRGDIIRDSTACSYALGADYFLCR